LIKALDSSEVVVQQAAIAALGEIKAVGVVDRILRFTDAEDWLVRQRLAEALGFMPGEKTVSALKYMTKDANANVSQSATLSLERLGVS
jgi:HEAT repeat protein